VAVLGIMASAINTLEMDRTTPIISHWSLMCLPLVVFESGILISVILYLLTVNKNSPFNPDITKVPNKRDTTQPEDKTPTEKGKPPEKDYIKTNLEAALWNQVAAAALLHAVFMFFVVLVMLPDEFYVDFWTHEGTRDRSDLVVTDWQLALCAVWGSITGLLGGYIGLYYCSEGNQDSLIQRGGAVREVYDACQYSENAAVVTIVGISLGYKASVATVMNIAIGIYATHSLGHGLGVAFAAMGSLGSVCSVLITTTFGPIAKNARAISVMSGMDEESRKAAEQLATAGSNVLAMSKGYSVTVAALCAFAMMQAYVMRANVSRAHISIFEPLCFAGLLVGSMMPYMISAMVIHAITKAARRLKDNIQGQFLRNAEDIMCGVTRPDYDECISEATAASLQYLTPVGLMVVLVPFTVGLLFGRAAVCGLVLGCIISAIPHGASTATMGGIWSMTRQLLQTNYYGPSQGYDEWKARLMLAESMDEEDLEIEEKEAGYGIDYLRENVERCKPQMAYEVAEVAENVADPLKDAVAPSMSILMKEMAMISCVLGPYFASTRGGYGVIGCSLSRDCNGDKYPLEGFDILMSVVYSLVACFFAVATVYKCCLTPSTDHPNYQAGSDDAMIQTPLMRGADSPQYGSESSIEAAH